MDHRRSLPRRRPTRGKQRRVGRFHLTNQSMMAHPMHLHGHFSSCQQHGTGRGPFKDTVLVEPHMGEATFDFVTDNPGDWFFHCHIIYHMESGMARVVSWGIRWRFTFCGGQDDVLGETTRVAEAADDVQGVTPRWSSTLSCARAARLGLRSCVGVDVGLETLNCRLSSLRQD